MRMPIIATNAMRNIAMLTIAMAPCDAVAGSIGATSVPDLSVSLHALQGKVWCQKLKTNIPLGLEAQRDCGEPTTGFVQSEVADERVSRDRPRDAMPDEFSAENRALIDATVAFFDEVEARPAARNRFPVFTTPLSATKSKASADDAAVLTRMGPVGHLTVYRTTWYPMDRLLGTVDFMGTWDGNRNLVCGYLTWDLSDPDAPRLEALTASFVDLEDLKHVGDIQVHQSLMEANCAFGAIDDNYHVFDVTG